MLRKCVGDAELAAAAGGGGDPRQRALQALHRNLLSGGNFTKQSRECQRDYSGRGLPANTATEGAYFAKMIWRYVRSAVLGSG